MRWLPRPKRASALCDRCSRQDRVVPPDVTDRTVTILECRAPWREDYGPEWTRRGIARFRYTAKHKAWTLYWSDRNQRWHKYDLIAPSADVLALLDELDRDPTCIFWG